MKQSELVLKEIEVLVKLVEDKTLEFKQLESKEQLAKERERLELKFKILRAIADREQRVTKLKVDRQIGTTTELANLDTSNVLYISDGMPKELDRFLSWLYNPNKYTRGLLLNPKTLFHTVVLDVSASTKLPLKNLEEKLNILQEAFNLSTRGVFKDTIKVVILYN